jgi:hypothetical protein
MSRSPEWFRNASDKFIDELNLKLGESPSGRMSTEAPGINVKNKCPDLRMFVKLPDS